MTHLAWVALVALHITVQQALPVLMEELRFQALAALAALTQAAHQAALAVQPLALVAAAVAAAAQALFCCAGNNWWDNPTLT
jgi:hypothetical protein